MFIEIKNTFTDKEKEWKIVFSYFNDEEIENAVKEILENSNYKEILPIIQKEKNRFKFDSELTKYINASFSKKIPINERKEKIKKIIKWIFNLAEQDLVWQNKWQLRVIQSWIKNKSK